jgi:putative FmdB family regulatory protein
MPIYAYSCAACGHAQDVLQKMSDAVLTQCPACGAQALEKQVTAAGFQLKGSGWYVTDFRGGNTGKKEGEKAEGDAKPAEGAPAKAEPAADAKSEARPAEKPAEKAATPAAAPAAAPTPASGT